MPLRKTGVGSYRGPGPETRAGRPAGSSISVIGLPPLADTTKCRATSSTDTGAVSPARRPTSTSTVFR
jgi:hypothetical protein